MVVLKLALEILLTVMQINNQTNIIKMAETFMNHFLKMGFKNPYDNSAPSIIRTGSGGDTVNGRLRLDETDCRNSGGKGGYKKMVLWVKTHKDHENSIFLLDSLESMVQQVNHKAFTLIEPLVVVANKLHFGSKRTKNTILF